MKLTIKTNSETYARIIRGVEKFGNDYRHCHNKTYYHIISGKVVDRNHVELLLREV